MMIRHGETQADVEDRIEGSFDSPLTERGMRQARALSLRLVKEGYRCDILYSSPLTRAMETARLVSDAVGMSVIADPRLAELNTGELAGMKRDEADRQYPLLPGGMRAYIPVPGGESQLDQARRVGEFFLQVLEEYIDRRVCVVAHGGTINALLRLVYGLPVNQPLADRIPRFRMGDTAMSRIEVRGSLDVLTHYVNDWSHARGM